MESHYRIAFTVTARNGESDDEMVKAIERALYNEGISIGPVGVQTSRETLRRQRRAAQIAKAHPDVAAAIAKAEGK